jgi:hypothetical protein
MEVSSQIYVPVALSTGKRVPSVHWVGGWVGLRVGLDAVKKRKNSFHFLAGNLTPAVQPVA